jgi:hypothetical protein
VSVEYVLKNTPGGEGDICNAIWWNKCEEGKRKGGNVKENRKKENGQEKGCENMQKIVKMTVKSVNED